jgi:hypothetical protein
MLNLMKPWIEKYLDHLDSQAGVEPEFRKISDADDYPPLHVITYRDTPEKGSITAFTAGLSAVSHPDWKLARPELAICVDTEDESWGLAVGYTAYRLRGKCPFCYGDTIRFGERISDESEMSAFFVFAPSIMEKEMMQIELPEWKISIAQMYPIYEGEIELIEKEGLEKFFLDKNINFYDVQRRDISK